MEEWKAQIEALLEAEDHAALFSGSRATLSRTLRYLSGRLSSHDADTKWRAVRALGAIAGEPGLLSEDKVTELVRRYFWSLNDESGAVPFGVPEAIGEILARRPSLQPAFLPLLCSMIHEEETVQTGAIGRGVVWAIGRIGSPALGCGHQMLQCLGDMAESHPEEETRRVAAWTLGHLKGLD